MSPCSFTCLMLNHLLPGIHFNHQSRFNLLPVGKETQSFCSFHFLILIFLIQHWVLLSFSTGCYGIFHLCSQRFLCSFFHFYSLVLSCSLALSQSISFSPNFFVRLHFFSFAFNRFFTPSSSWQVFQCECDLWFVCMCVCAFFRMRKLSHNLVVANMEYVNKRFFRLICYR